MAAQRHGSVRAVPVKNSQIGVLAPVIDKIISSNAELMSDGHHSYRWMGHNFATHDTVSHGKREYARGQTHTNTAESFGALLERTKLGVFHFLSNNHIHRYLNELEFRWHHRIPEEKITRTGMKKNCHETYACIASAGVIAQCCCRQTTSPNKKQRDFFF